MWANTSSVPSSPQRSTWQKPSSLRHLLEHLPHSVRDRAVSRFDEWRRRRALLAELMSLSDRDLADLGIGRGDFPAILDGTYRRDGQAFGSSAEEQQRPLTFAHWAEQDAQPALKPRTPDFTAVFFPFWSRPSWFEQYSDAMVAFRREKAGPRPSWFEQYWYGDDKTDERLR